MLREDIVKDDGGCKAVFTEHGALASQTTAARVPDSIYRLPDAVSAYTQVKMKGASKLLRATECSTIWIQLPRSRPPANRDTTNDAVVSLESNLYGLLLADLLWERKLEELLLRVSQSDLSHDNIVNCSWKNSGSSFDDTLSLRRFRIHLDSFMCASSERGFANILPPHTQMQESDSIAPSPSSCWDAEAALRKVYVTTLKRERRYTENTFIQARPAKGCGRQPLKT